ncbi:hypothetical protein BJ508DRAFT_417211 [Ascobolus immersus RN42]|uniref:Uncharacterized protein n=1 Tax=Ascobolus immersus RN42 TaxID=1160509 RepID=A0A3N4HU48_ASCIM|nr:hypothetical protein BJ508DRAFT_417211 [Ascobolus immersus RN42]
MTSPGNWFRQTRVVPEAHSTFSTPQLVFLENHQPTTVEIAGTVRFEIKQQHFAMVDEAGNSTSPISTVDLQPQNAIDATPLSQEQTQSPSKYRLWRKGLIQPDQSLIQPQNTTIKTPRVSITSPSKNQWARHQELYQQRQNQQPSQRASPYLTTISPSERRSLYYRRRLEAARTPKPLMQSSMKRYPPSTATANSKSGTISFICTSPAPSNSPPLR